MSTPFRIVPLPRSVVEQARRTLTDAHGHRLQPQLNTAVGAYPCRFTLRMIRPGEEMILLSHSPFRLDHPYREVGPVFITRHVDEGYADVHRWPPELNPLSRTFRAYNAAEEIVDARLGTVEPEKLIADLFAHPEVDCIHVRSLTHGCYTFKIERA